MLKRDTTFWLIDRNLQRDSKNTIHCRTRIIQFIESLVKSQRLLRASVINCLYALEIIFFIFFPSYSNIILFYHRFSVNAQGQVFMTTPPESFPDSEYLVVILVQDNGLPPRQATAHVRVILPALTPTGDPPITATGSLPKTPTITATEAPTNAAVKEEPNDVVPIVLGVIAAVLLFVVIVLAILLVRRWVFFGVPTVPDAFTWLQENWSHL